jgi:hypothetical protein
MRREFTMNIASRRRKMQDLFWWMMIQCMSDEPWIFVKDLANGYPVLNSSIL